jgi:cytochrome P450
MTLSKTPPGPKPHFLIGHLPEFVKSPLNFLIESTRDYGDIIDLHLPLGRTYYLNHPDYIEFMLVAGHRNFKKGKIFDLIRPLLGNGLVSSDGEFWLRQRRLMQPAFHRERIKAYADVMVNYTERMLEGWEDGQTRNISEDMIHLTMEIVSRLLFNAEVSSEEAAISNHAFTEGLEVFQAKLSSPIQIPQKYPTPGNLRYKRAVGQLDRIIDEIIQRNRAEGSDKGDLLSMLLQVRDEDGKGMSNQQLRDELLTLFLAGHETTAGMLTWAWYLLSQHPQVEARLNQELQTVLAGRSPTVNDLPQLPYTDMVIKETLRLYPVGWMLSRETLQDVEIGGYHIPKGMQLMASPWTMHRDPRYYSDPHAFKPERWESEETKKLPKYAYLPFGGGPRQCIGNTFALTEAALILATVAQQYRLELMPGKPVVPNASATIRPKHALKMKLIRQVSANFNRELLAEAGSAGD